MSSELNTGVQGEDGHDRDVLRQVQEEGCRRRQECKERNDVERKTDAESDLPELRNEDDEVHEVVPRRLSFQSLLATLWFPFR